MVKIEKVLKNVSLKDFNVDSKGFWVRTKIVMQFVSLREKMNLTQNDVALKMGVMRQQITRFENLNNSPTITFLVKYANALDTEIDVLLKGVHLQEITN